VVLRADSGQLEEKRNYNSIWAYRLSDNTFNNRKRLSEAGKRIYGHDIFFQQVTGVHVGCSRSRKTGIVTQYELMSI
jgi:hypothetical protein